jgi:hypothetical protein
MDTVIGVGCLTLAIGILAGSFMTIASIEEKQHTEKSGCEYVEQAPCKIIYIKDDK